MARNDNLQSHEEHAERTPEEARQGKELGVMRYVLFVSAALAVILLGGLFLGFV